MRNIDEAEKEALMRHFVNCLNTRECKVCYNIEKDIEARFCKWCGSELIKKQKYTYNDGGTR